MGDGVVIFVDGGDVCVGVFRDGVFVFVGGVFGDGAAVFVVGVLGVVLFLLLVFWG